MRYKNLAVLAVTLLMAVACGSDVELPPIPEVATEGLLPEIARQLEQARRAALDSPNDAVAAGSYGMTLAAYSLSEPALVAYERATLAAPRDFRWHYARGHLLDHLQRHDEALVSLRRAHELEDGNTSLTVQLGNTLFALGRVNEAKELYSRALEENPRLPLAIVGLAQCAIAEERWEDALTELRPLREAGVDVREIYFISATALRSLGRGREAQAELRLFDRAGELSVRQFDPLVRQISALNRSHRKHALQAQYLFERGDYEGAIGEMEAVLEKDPDSISSHRHLVYLYGETGDAARAQQHFESARALGDDHHELYSNFGHSLRRAGRLNEAADQFDAALAREPADVRARMQLAFIQAQRNETDLAVTNAERVLEADAANRDARLLLGETFVGQGRYAEAVEVLRPAADVFGKHSVRIARTLAASQSALGDYAGARASLQQARQYAARVQNSALLAALETDLQRLADLEASDIED